MAPAAGRLKTSIRAAGIAALVVSGLVWAVGGLLALFPPAVSAWRLLLPWPPVDKVRTALLAGVASWSMSVLLWNRWQSRRWISRSFRASVAIYLCLWLCMLPLLRMAAAWGRRAAPHADCLIVFGARTYADGRMSTALLDRIRTASNYALANPEARLILSGGPAEGPRSEVQAMADYATNRGIAAHRLVADESGLSTSASVANLRQLAGQYSCRRIVAVSQFYHLPRIEMEGLRLGLRLELQYALPSLVIVKLPALVAREIPAFWLYWLLLWRSPAA